MSVRRGRQERERADDQRSRFRDVRMARSFIRMSRSLSIRGCCVQACRTGASCCWCRRRGSQCWASGNPSWPQISGERYVGRFRPAVSTCTGAAVLRDAPVVRNLPPVASQLAFSVVGRSAPDGTMCCGAMCAQKGRSKRSPYVYACRSCGRCAISGPLADESLEHLLFPEAPEHARLPESVRQRWQSGEMGLEEKRGVIASIFTHCIVRPGAKGNRAWDYSRLEPVGR